MAVLYPSAGLRAADSSYFGRMTDLQSLEAGLGRNICGNKRPAAAMGAGYNGGWGSGSGGSIADQISAGGRPANWQSSCAVLTSQWAALSAKETQITTTNTTSSTPTTSTTTSSSHTFSEKEAVLSENETITMSLQKDRAESHHAMFRETFKDLVTLPKPLSISDLSNPPSHGSTLRVAYQGVPGAYSEAAAGKAYPKCEAIPCEQFEAAFQAVELWIADRAVLPIENSLGGSIHRNYDLLLRHRLHIVGEVQFAVHHCLLGLPGVKKEDLKRVISHPQALSQCEHTLAKLGVAREAVDDTAGAAQFVAMNQLRDTGAVASAKAAEIYGLDILADGIQDDTSNVTRFLMLAREPIIPRTDRKFKTSIVFALEEEPGALFRALSAFALRNINLTKIESRPQRKRPLRVVDDSNHGTAKYFEYLFYIDFEASMADPRAQNALGQIQEFASFLRVLGCYPMDMTPVLTGPSSSSSSNSE